MYYATNSLADYAAGHAESVCIWFASSREGAIWDWEHLVHLFRNEMGLVKRVDHRLLRLELTNGTCITCSYPARMEYLRGVVPQYLGVSLAVWRNLAFLNQRGISTLKARLHGESGEHVWAMANSPMETPEEMQVYSFPSEGAGGELLPQPPQPQQQTNRQSV